MTDTSTLAPEKVWQAVLDELSLQMTQATFATWLKDSRLLRLQADGVWVVGVRNEQARAWVGARLQEAIERTATAIVGETVGVVFEVAAPATVRQEPAGSGGSGNGGADPGGGAEFDGFEPITANFTTVPNQYFEVVLPEGPPSLTAFVGAVIHQTIGQVVNWHTGERREWWEASYTEIGRAAGISRGSVVKVIRMGIERGYVVREEAENTFRYRLRRIGEPVGSYP